MGAVKRDLEQLVSEKAEEFAQQRYGTAFDNLSNALKMQVWTDAEVAIQEKLNEMAERHGEAIQDYLADLEACRREGN
jgi:hypothetical protein